MPFKKGNKIRLGKKANEETRKKMSLARKGKYPYWVNTEKIRKIWSERAKLNIGEKNPNWRGGIGKCEDCEGILLKRGVKKCFKCSLKHRKKEKNHNWKGGLKENPNYYNKWNLARQEKMAGRKKSEQCEICGAIGKICFDHDHTTGKFRGWICGRCNLVLGHVKDSKDLLSAIIEYLGQKEY